MRLCLKNQITKKKFDQADIITTILLLSFLSPVSSLFFMDAVTLAPLWSLFQASWLSPGLPACCSHFPRCSVLKYAPGSLPASLVSIQRGLPWPYLKKHAIPHSSCLICPLSTWHHWCYVCLYECAHACINTHTLAQVHTHTHTHVHIYVFKGDSRILYRYSNPQMFKCHIE